MYVHGLFARKRSCCCCCCCILFSRGWLGSMALLSANPSGMMIRLLFRYKLAKLNPKALLASEMYGQVNALSGEWTTGVLAAMWAKCNQRTNKFNTWVLCDGPVDAYWIENLNTVLDDNKILTLANGDRIPMTDNVRLLFENESLDNASPATVSRTGIIYVSASDLGWWPPVQAWIARLGNADLRSALEKLFEKFVQASNQAAAVVTDNCFFQCPKSHVQALVPPTTGQQHSLTLKSIRAAVLTAAGWLAALIRYVGTSADEETGHLFQFLRTNTRPVMGSSEVGLTASLCALLGALIHEHVVPDTNTSSSNNGGGGANGSSSVAATSSSGVGPGSGSGAGTSLLTNFNGAIDEDDLEKLFLYSVAWSIGGLLSEDDRPKLDAYLRALAATSQEGHASDEVMPKLQEDEEDTIFECVLAPLSSLTTFVATPSHKHYHVCILSVVVLAVNDAMVAE